MRCVPRPSGGHCGSGLGEGRRRPHPGSVRSRCSEALEAQRDFQLGPATRKGLTQPLLHLSQAALDRMAIHTERRRGRGRVAAEVQVGAQRLSQVGPVAILIQRLQVPVEERLARCFVTQRGRQQSHVRIPGQPGRFHEGDDERRPCFTMGKAPAFEAIAWLACGE